MIIAPQLCYSTSTALLCYDRSTVVKTAVHKAFRPRSVEPPLVPAPSEVLFLDAAANGCSRRGGNDASETSGPPGRCVARRDGRPAHHELRARQAVARGVRAPPRRGARSKVDRQAHGAHGRLGPSNRSPIHGT